MNRCQGALERLQRDVKAGHLHGCEKALEPESILKKQIENDRRYSDAKRDIVVGAIIVFSIALGVSAGGWFFDWIFGR